MMKALVQKLSSGLLMVAALATTGTMNAQIDYYDDFSTDKQLWSDRDFRTTDIAVCGGGFALRAIPVSGPGEAAAVETVSRSLGVSNGEEVVLSYDYKLLYYDSVLPHIAVDKTDWGLVLVEYGPTQNGPWTQLDLIRPDNHYTSENCTLRQVAFTPAIGEEVFLRISAKGGSGATAGYYLYVDNISLLQDTMTIAPLFTDNAFKVWPNPVTDYLHLDYRGSIDDVVIYNMQGQVVVVENIDRNLRRLDMSGLSEGNYVMKVYSDDGLRTIPVVKN